MTASAPRTEWTLEDLDDPGSATEVEQQPDDLPKLGRRATAGEQGCLAGPGESHDEEPGGGEAAGRPDGVLRQRLGPGRVPVQGGERRQAGSGVDSQQLGGRFTSGHFEGVFEGGLGPAPVPRRHRQPPEGVVTPGG